MKAVFPSLSLPSNLAHVSFSKPAQMACLALGITCVGFYLLFHGLLNPLVAVLFLIPLCCIALISLRAAIALNFVYLLLLGDLRRIGDLIYGFPKTDSMILVPPVFALLLATPILLRITLDSAIVKAMFALLCIMGLEIVNPRQGGIVSGLAATIFWIIPSLWFWIGLRYATPSLVNLILFRVVLPLASAAALLGYFQTFIGFLPWEQAWIDVVKVHFRALGLANGTVRAFGFSTNQADFALLLAMGCAVSSGAVFARRRAFALLFLLLFPMLILSAVRNVLVKLILAMAIQFAGNSRRQAKEGGSLLRLAGFLLLAAAAIGYSASRVKDTSNTKNASAAESAFSHEAGGLTHVDAKHSTVGIHSQNLVRGLVSGFTSPIGYGLGSSAGGAESSAKSGDTDAVATTEFDISDAFISLGVPGGFLYLYIIYLAIRMMWAVCSDSASTLSLSAAGVVLCGALAWISTPGGYTLSPIFWLIIGAATKDQENRLSATSTLAVSTLGATLPRSE